jgi:HEAT repeat protein
MKARHFAAAMMMIGSVASPRASAAPPDKADAKDRAVFQVPEEALRWSKELAGKSRAARGDLKSRRPAGLADLDSAEAIDRAIEAAVADLADRERESDAIVRLRYLGEKASDALVRGTKSENASVARWCCVVLSHRGAKAVAPLMEVLKTSPDAGLRSVAAGELGATFQRRAVPALIEALDDANQGVRTAAIHALMYLRDRRAIEPLRRHVNEVGYGHVATMAIDHILEPQGYAEWLPEQLDDWQLCQDAQTLKGEQFGPAEWDRLVKLMGAKQWAVSTAGLLALADLDVRSAVPAIIALPAGEMKFQALATIDTTEAFEHLIASLNRQENREAALNGIANGADRWGAPLLVALLDDPSLRIEKRSFPSPRGGQSEWPEEHRAHLALSTYFSRFGLRGHSVNLAQGLTADIPAEISRLKEWWKEHGRDFVAGRDVPSPDLTSVMDFD